MSATLVDNLIPIGLFGRAPYVITLLKQHVDDELQEILIYIYELYKQDSGAEHRIPRSNSFEPWWSSILIDLCEEILPISPTLVHLHTEGTVRADEFVAQCLRWKEHHGTHHPIQKLWHANGTVYKSIHKIRTDAGGVYRPRDFP